MPLTKVDAAGLMTGVLPVANGGTGSSSSSGALDNLLPAQTGNSGRFLTTDGSNTSWGTVAAFASGTVMLFRQTSAPTGWTKDTTNFNDSALRVVTGAVSSGGTQGFTTAFASQTPSGSVSTSITAVSGSVSTTVNSTTATNQSTTAGGSVSVSGGSVGSTTLTSTQIPGHTHDTTLPVWGGCAGFTSWGQRSLSTPTTTITSASTGGGGSHTHSFTTPTASFSGTSHSHTQDAHNHTASSSFSFGSGSATSSFSGNAINLAVKYCDVIFATKD